MVGQHATRVDGADNHRPRAGGGGGGRIHFRQAGIGLAAGQPPLTDAPLAAPVDDAEAGLCGQRVWDISQKQEVRIFEFHRSEPGLGGNTAHAPLDASCAKH